MPAPIFLAAWTLMAVGYTYSGLTKLDSPSWLDGTAVTHVLENPLARPGAFRTLILSMPVPALAVATWCALAFEILFAPLSLSARLRPFVWSAMLGMQLSLIALIDFADLTFGMVVLHLFTFDPAWLKPVGGPVTRVFYDGSCGLCHGVVRFLLAEDRHESFRFAALQGESFAAAVPEAKRATLPDSVVVLTGDGELLVRSRAALHLLVRLGGLWRVVASVAGILPVRFLDALYDGVARGRTRVFGTRMEACPLMPKELRARFDP